MFAKFSFCKSARLWLTIFLQRGLIFSGLQLVLSKINSAKDDQLLSKIAWDSERMDSLVNQTGVHTRLCSLLVRVLCTVQILKLGETENHRWTWSLVQRAFQKRTIRPTLDRFNEVNCYTQEINKSNNEVIRRSTRLPSYAGDSNEVLSLRQSLFYLASIYTANMR